MATAHAMQDTVWSPDTDATLQRIAEDMDEPPYSTPPSKHAKAFMAVREGRVAEAPDADAYQVQSEQRTKTYTVQPGGLCTCPYGETHPDERYGCYHPVAVEMYRRLQHAMPPETAQDGPGETLPSQHDRTDVPKTDVIIEPVSGQNGALPAIVFPDTFMLQLPDVLQVHHSGAAMQEAPFSANMMVETPKGFHVQFTVRGQEEQELFQRMTKLLKWFEEKAFVPRKGRLDVPASPTPVSPSLPAPQGTPICEYHGEMKPSPKAPGTWYCTKKMGDGSYCKSRA